MRLSKKDKPYLMMISSMIIVGTIGVFRRYIPLSSPVIAFWRGFIGTISLLVFAILTRKKIWAGPGIKKLSVLFLNGVLLGINWILLFEAFEYTTVAKATLAYYMQPTILLLLSPLVFKEKLTVKKIICAVIAAVGMVLITGILEVSGNEKNGFTGIIFGLGAAFVYTLLVIINKKIEDVDPFQKTVVQLFAAAVVLIPYLLLNGEFSISEYNTMTVVLLLILGVVHTGIVYALYFGCMNGLKAQTISVLSYIDPVTAVVVSNLILKENLSLLGILGAILIIGSAIISERE